MNNLNKFTVEELQAEIERREKQYRFTFKGEEFVATMDEIIELQAALNKLNPPADPFELYRKMMEKNMPWRTDQPRPWTEPVYPGNPWPTAPYTDPPIWRDTEPRTISTSPHSTGPVDPWKISLDNPKVH